MTRRNWLFAVSVLYVIVPNVIFQLGYLKPAVGLPLFFLTCGATALALRNIRREPAPHASGPGQSVSWLWLIGGVVVWVGLAGVGGIGYQNSDWEKSNAILLDLVSKPWPVTYDTTAWPQFGPGDYFLVYYIGYYLPAAAVGKMGGWLAANCALFVWTCLGVALAVALVLEWLGDRSAETVQIALLIVVCFGGLDIVATTLMWGLPSPGAHIDWWNRPWFQYPSLTSHLVWAPQHGVTGWVISSLVLHALELGVGIRRLGLITGAALLTTPFAVVGLVVFGVAIIMHAIRAERWRELVSFENVAGAVIALPASLFLTANAFAFPIEFLPGQSGFWTAWARLIAVELLVLLPFALDRPRIAWAGALTLLMLPFWRMGQFNDLVMRASIPAIWLLCACAIRVVLVCDEESGPRASWWRRRQRVILTGLLWLGAGASVQELTRAIGGFQIGRTWDTAHVAPVVGPGPDELRLLRRQYQGDANSVFFRSLARTPTPTSSGREGP